MWLICAAVMMNLLLLIGGLVVLVIGAEALVRGASKLATGLGISPLIIGLTVVAYGTSAPEMAVSVLASVRGQVDLALGNVVGSNIFNVLFILGISALIVPLTVSQQLVRLDVPLMIGVSLLVLVLGLDGRIGRIDGALLFGGILAYTAFLIMQSRRQSSAVGGGDTRASATAARATAKQWTINLLLIMGGLLLLVLGSHWLVSAAVTIATAFGISELIIGLTIVAAGTSLPEVATSVIASIRGERDLAVGNVVGSNIFNLLGVLGLASLLAPGGTIVAPAALRFDIPVMIAVAIACLPIFFTGHRISRLEGALFLGYYAAYTLYLILAATRHATLPLFSAAMIWFVIPLTVLTLLIVTTRAIRGTR